MLWSVPTELTVVSSQKKQSIIVVKNLIIFSNSVGDITAVDFDSGEIIWQTPTQVLEFAKNITLRNSDIVSDGNSIYMSNNKNEFFSLDVITGIIKWKQEINSSVRSIIYNDLIFSISNEGYFFVIDSKSGNIIRITDIFSIFKSKNRLASHH